jgi:putative acetyltransferase
MEMLFLVPKSRGKGIGRMLLEFAVAELGVNKVDVNEQNSAAVGFYEHMGFKAVGRSPVDGEGKPFPLLHMELGAL